MFDLRVAPPRDRGDDHAVGAPFAAEGRQRLEFAFLRHARLHRRFGMREAGCAPQDHRRLELLAHLQADAHEAAGLFAIRRFDAGEFAEARILAIVLLVLRGERARIVGAHQHQPAFDAGVRKRHQAVGGDVDADVLHRCQGARPTERRADDVIQRHLLVAGPLRLDAGIAGEVFQNLRRRCAGISRGVLHPRFPRPQGDGFVARQ